MSPSPFTIEFLEARQLMAATPWGAFPKLIGLDQAVANYPAVTGAGGAIAFIDTGMNYNDPALGGGIGPGHRVVAGYDFVDNDTNPMDSDGHGTGVASQAAATTFTYSGAQYQGVAPGTNLIALRVDDGTFGWNKEAPLIEKALQWVIAHRDQYNITVVNMSLGQGHYADPTTLAPIADELATLNDMGVFLVAASGNSGVKTPATLNYPAADPNVYAVGSIDVNDVISKFTERNQYMDILAPGELVPLVYYMPATNSRSIFQGSGTSFATAYISGMGALLKQVDPTLTPAEIMSIIKRSGSANLDGDKEAAPSTGLTFRRLNVNAALAMAFDELDDAHEHNDTLATATAMAFVNDTAALSGLTSLVGDADFYKFTLGAKSDVDFGISPTGADAPSVDLLNASGTLIKHLTATDAARLSAGTYYLRVNAPAATLDGDYGLSITRTPDDGLDNQTPQTAAPIDLDADGHGQLDNLVLLGNADDYYSVTFDGAKDAVFSVVSEGGGEAPTAQLLDTDGNVIANIVDGELTRRLDAGRYLIRVTSDATLGDTYGVAVDAAPFVPPGLNGGANGIVYDAAGTLHLFYYDTATTTLKYASRTAAGVWASPVVVDNSPGTGGAMSVGVDTLGRPGVAYYDAGHADLRYAHLVGSAWVVETVDSNRVTGYNPSLKFSSNGQPVISFYSKTAGDLRFAARSAAGVWSVTAVDTVGDVGWYSSLALNPATNRWAIAYVDGTRGWFRYAEQGKSGWVLSTADATTKPGGGHVSLQFSPKTNRPSFSYYDAYNADLKLATYTGTAWTNQIVASKNVVGLYSNLRITATGAMDVLYYHRGANAVYRATSATGAGTWSIAQIESDGGPFITRATTPDGDETISYARSTGVGVDDL